MLLDSPIIKLAFTIIILPLYPWLLTQELFLVHFLTHLSISLYIIDYNPLLEIHSNSDVYFITFSFSSSAFTAINFWCPLQVIFPYHTLNVTILRLRTESSFLLTINPFSRQSHLSKGLNFHLRIIMSLGQRAYSFEQFLNIVNAYKNIQEPWTSLLFMMQYTAQLITPHDHSHK